jgi:hypothetical protein
VFETVAQGEPCVLLTPWTIHRLQKKIAKVKVLEPLRLSTVLREDEFQFVSSTDDKLRSRLRAHANPIDPWRWHTGTVCLNGDFKAHLVECADERFIELQQRFPSCTYYKTLDPRGRRERPSDRDCLGKFVG